MHSEGFECESVEMSELQDRHNTVACFFNEQNLRKQGSGHHRNADVHTNVDTICRASFRRTQTCIYTLSVGTMNTVVLQEQQSHARRYENFAVLQSMQLNAYCDEKVTHHK